MAPAQNELTLSMLKGLMKLIIIKKAFHMRGYPKVSGLATWSEKGKWHNSLPLGEVVSLHCESV
jgi:hypothetical protein